MAKVLKLAAFSDGEAGGNPVGVHVDQVHPDDIEMQRLATEAGLPETIFAMPTAGGFRVRTFTPASEVGFRGDATIALGAVLAMREGDGLFALTHNNGRIFVEGHSEGEGYAASLQSAPTKSGTAPGPLVEAVLEIFDFGKVDLHPRIPAGRAIAGADYLLIGLANREALRARAYGLAACRMLMSAAGLAAVVLAWPENPRRLHTRNPFTSAAQFEDPATAAAAAALGGRLRDLKWPHGGSIEIVHGEETGHSALIRAHIPEEKGSPIRISGQARFID